MSGMFWAWELKEINLSTFKIDNVTNIHGMFANCKSLKELNLSHTFKAI